MEKMNEFIYHSKPSIDDSDIKAVLHNLKVGMIAEGEMTKKFENNFREYIGTKYAIATTSGTLALFLSLKSLGIEKGDNVICPSYVCSAVSDSIFQTGAKPNLVDIEENYFISYNSVKKKINKKTKAIIIPHLFGFSFNIDNFYDFELPIIEDCAQNIGGYYPNKSIKIGNMSDIAIFSFHATKFMTTGEGGMILLNDDGLYEQLKELKFGNKKVHPYKYSYVLPDLNASLGMSQLKRIENLIKKRKQIAEMYSKRINNFSFMKHPVQKNNIFFRYPIRLIKKNIKVDRIINKFFDKGIKVNKPVDELLHKKLNVNGNFKISEIIFKSVFSIPLYPAMSEKGIEIVIKAFNEIGSEIEKNGNS